MTDGALPGILEGVRRGAAVSAIRGVVDASTAGSMLGATAGTRLAISCGALLGTDAAAALGIGIATMATEDGELYDELKGVLFNDSAIAGEAAATTAALAPRCSARCVHRIVICSHSQEGRSCHSC